MIQRTVGLVLFLTSLACAAAGPQGGRAPPGADGDQAREPLYLPDAPAPVIPSPPPDAPAATVAAPGARLARVFVRSIRITGATVFASAEFARLTAPYENREVSFEELQALRVTLTRLYVEHGYINSGALLPDQQVRDGVVEMHIVEGTLSTVEVNNAHALRPVYYARRLAPESAVPLRVDALQERIQLLLLQPLVKRINAEITPGERMGEARLVASVTERSPYIFNADFDNAIAPSLGGLRARGEIGHRSLLGFGDTVSIRYEGADGLRRKSLSYAVPVTRHDTLVGVWVDSVASHDVEEPFNVIDIDSRYDGAGVSIAQPVLRTPASDLTLTAAFDRRTSHTYLLHEPFSFAPGVEDGRSRVSVLRLSQDWTHRSRDQAMAARSVFNVGLDVMKATVNSQLPDGRFFAWLGQFQYARLLFGGQAIVRADVQLTPDALLPLEKLAIGGGTSVRGYRENQLVRDQGFVTSVEYRHPLYRASRWPVAVDGAVFADGGGAWDRAVRTAEPKLIGSVGVGLRGELGGRLRFQLYWGHALTTARDAGGDLQDDGIHFAVSARAFE